MTLTDPTSDAFEHRLPLRAHRPSRHDLDPTRPTASAGSATGRSRRRRPTPGHLVRGGLARGGAAGSGVLAGGLGLAAAGRRRPTAPPTSTPGPTPAGYPLLGFRHQAAGRELSSLAPG